jgi:hypothetical protein
MKSMVVIFNKNTIKPKEGSEFSMLSRYPSLSSFYLTFVYSTSSPHTLSWCCPLKHLVPLTNSSHYTIFFPLIIACRDLKGKGGSRCSSSEGEITGSPVQILLEIHPEGRQCLAPPPSGIAPVQGNKTPTIRPRGEDSSLERYCPSRWRY